MLIRDDISESAELGKSLEDNGQSIVSVQRSITSKKKDKINIKQNMKIFPKRNLMPWVEEKKQQ